MFKKLTKIWGIHTKPAYILGPFSLMMALGCQAPQPKACKVLDPLPSPYLTKKLASPNPRIIATPRKNESSNVSSKHPWLPPHPLSSRWRYIVIHHSATDYGSLEDIQQWHLNNGWEYGCGYHFVIGNGTNTPDGMIEYSYRWTNQIHGAHTKLLVDSAVRQGLDPNYYNEHGIGICLVGNFNQDYQTDKQMDSLVRLVRFLMEKCRIPQSRIYGHGNLKPTDCPGKNFSMSDFKRMLR